MAMIRFRLNREEVSIDAPLNMRLLDVLRGPFQLTGVKEGCGEGECGACSVLLNQRLVHSCVVPLANVQNQEVMTIEGYTLTRGYRTLMEAFDTEGAVQCGFCTPGMILASQSLLHQHPHPTEEDIRIGLSGNLCRCTGYQMIVRAVLRASIEGEGLWSST